MSYRLLLKYTILLLALALVLTSCADDDEQVGEASCASNETYDPIQGRCNITTRYDDRDTSSSTPDEDASSNGDPDVFVPGHDSGSGNDDVAIQPDTSPTPDVDDGLTCYIDADGDGHYAIECGGDDCDDSDPAVNPSQEEICSFKDNNCSGVINDNLDCTFYAHTSTNLYVVDPFAPSLQHLMAVPSGLFDIDTHPNGTLYGISTTTLYSLAPGATQWSTVGSMGTIGNANGLCIDQSGQAFITASTNLYALDVNTANATYRGSTSPFNSSGDCVINKSDTLYMSASGSGHDRFVLLNSQNGAPNVIGSTGFSQIYGLTAAWGFMFGLTGHGHLIDINVNTGAATQLHTFPGKTWYGAASSPGR